MCFTVILFYSCYNSNSLELNLYTCFILLFNYVNDLAEGLVLCSTFERGQYSSTFESGRRPNLGVVVGKYWE